MDGREATLVLIFHCIAAVSILAGRQLDAGTA